MKILPLSVPGKLDRVEEQCMVSTMMSCWKWETDNDDVVVLEKKVTLREHK